MNKIELKKILDDHKLWLEGKGGSRADLSDADLKWVDLRGVDLRCADLRCAILKDADLFRADLRGANLSGAILYHASLMCADLSGANLYYADLTGADLTDANLSNVDLSGAHLGGANLNDAVGIASFHGERAVGIARIFGDDIMIRIGCKVQTKEKWLLNYVELGKANGYSEEEITKYGNWIKSVA